MRHAGNKHHAKAQAYLARAGYASGGSADGYGNSGPIEVGGRKFTDSLAADSAMRGAYREGSTVSDEEIAREPRDNQEQLRKNRDFARAVSPKLDAPEGDRRGGRVGRKRK
jgi:hypothetical protein